ncbi:hypothetical protein H2201_008187 [Coniosporium apollinis]|uniref:MARVEL domain-containing protein n=1 Tax=Coniosporium apollinis TaxID=61459 RepID=A0ABQ9NKD5_9PEZI|nr:hypothetical protein H2201_008187 [Coniosporium apollinis]
MPNSGWRIWTASLMAVITGIACAGVQVLLVFTLRGPYANGVSWPITTIGIIAAVVLAAGLIPPYFELWKRNFRVIGINFIFLTTDWFGAFFSAMALVAQHTFDVIGGSSYTVCMILELGIFLSHILWRIRTRKIHREAKLAGLSYDDYVEDKHGLPAVDSSASLEKLPIPSSANGTDTDLEKGTTQVATVSASEQKTTL